MEEKTSLVGIALFTDPDKLAPFVRDADEAFGLGPAFQMTPGGETEIGISRLRPTGCGPPGSAGRRSMARVGIRRGTP